MTFVGEAMNTAAGIRSGAEVVEQTEQDRTGAGSLPDIADPASVAPRDARELSRHFFRRLTELEARRAGHAASGPASA